MLRGPGVSTGVSTSPRPSFQVVGGTLRLPAEGGLGAPRLPAEPAPASRGGPGAGGGGDGPEWVQGRTTALSRVHSRGRRIATCVTSRAP